MADVVFVENIKAKRKGPMAIAGDDEQKQEEVREPKASIFLKQAMAGVMSPIVEVRLA